MQPYSQTSRFRPQSPGFLLVRLYQTTRQWRCRSEATFCWAPNAYTIHAHTHPNNLTFTHSRTELHWWTWKLTGSGSVETGFSKLDWAVQFERLSADTLLFLRIIFYFYVDIQDRLVGSLLLSRSSYCSQREESKIENNSLTGITATITLRFQFAAPSGEKLLSYGLNASFFYVVHETIEKSAKLNHKGANAASFLIKPMLAFVIDRGVETTQRAQPTTL